MTNHGGSNRESPSTMDEWPVVKLSKQKIDGLSLLYNAARNSMESGARMYGEVRLKEYFEAIENLIDHSVRNPLDHRTKK